MKRILTLLLSLCLLLAIFPVSLAAFNDDTGEWDDDIFSEVIEDYSGVEDEAEETDTTDVNDYFSGGEEFEEVDVDVEEESFEEFTDDFYSDFSFDSENAREIAEAEYDINTIIISFRDVSEFPGKEKQYWNEVEKVTAWGMDYIDALDAYVVAIEDLDKNPNAVLNRFKNSKFIESVELNYLADFCIVTPNDPQYKLFQSTNLNTINAPEGWELITGGGPIIAVIDSGVANHPDLPPLLAGYSAVAGLSPNNDTSGHGTNVAGTIGAVGNNGIGGAGINWNAQIMPVKVDTATETLTVANIAKGIIWAADNGARVLNISLGTTADSATLKNAIDYAVTKGCVVVAAAGNNGGEVMYPARYSNVIGVGASSGTTALANFSSRGDGMDVSAPSTYYTPAATGGYSNVSGTSFASPQVAGLASLIIALGGDPVSIIKSNTSGPVSIINMGAALKAASASGKAVNQFVEDDVPLASLEPTTEAATPDTTPAPAQPETKPEPPPNPEIKLTGFAEVTYTAGDTYKEDGYKATDYTGKDISSKVTVTNNLNMKTAGIYVVTYKVTDDYGGSATMTRSVKVEPAPPAPPPATAPKITVIGSNPIILHSTSSTAYKEQSAKAIDYDGADISGLVEVSGSVNRTTPGTYTITYSVKSPKSGLTATTTRNVRIVAPTEKIVRTPYGFSGQAKQGAAITHTNIKADAFGWIDLKVASIDKNMTIKVEFIDTATKKAVFADTFSATGSKQYKIDEGKYELKVTVDKANGNSKYEIDLLMPEVLTVSFLDAEVPLGLIGPPKIAPIGSNPIILHLGGSDYFEQGARAIDYNDENISGKVEIIGEVDTSEAGTYYITYRVVNDLGFDAETTREVRVLAPNEFGYFDEIEVPLLNLPNQQVPLGNLPNQQVPLSDGPTTTYIVIKGDFLWAIAEKLYGDGSRWKEIYDMNKDAIGSNPDFLKIGQMLTVRVT